MISGRIMTAVTLGPGATITVSPIKVAKVLAWSSVAIWTFFTCPVNIVDPFNLSPSRFKTLPRNGLKRQLLVIHPATMSQDLVVELKTKEEFDSAINSGEHIIIDCSAEWCGPCKKMVPVYKELAKAYPKIKFYKVDIDEVKVEGIEAVPTFKLYHKKSLKGEFKGADKAGVISLLEKSVG
jgi:thioredoxin 1